MFVTQEGQSSPSSTPSKYSQQCAAERIMSSAIKVPPHVWDLSYVIDARYGYLPFCASPPPMIRLNCSVPLFPCS